MKLRDIFLTATVAAFSSLAAGARADGTNLPVAEAWAALTNFSLPQPPMAWQTNPPTKEQLAQFDDQQAAQAGVLADAARNFYTRFTDDPNAPRARTTELQALQLAVHFGATNRLAELLAREKAFVADTNAPEGMRYELRVDEIGRELQAASAAGADMPAEMEKAGRELVSEFPNGRTGYNILQELAENADLLKMQALAKFMAGSGGPPELTDIGKGMLRRLGAIGKPLPIEFTAADGRAVNLTTLSNQVVLVDFWATWCPGCVAGMPALKKLYAQYHTNGFEIVGINFDDDTNAAQQFVQTLGLAWPQYWGGRENKFGRDYAINALPAAWLVDRKGIVQDIHGQVNLEAKLAKLMAE